MLCTQVPSMSRRHVQRPVYLSNTAIAVLKLMVSDLTAGYTIRRIAHGIGQDYRITYETVRRLAENGVLSLERRANLHICRLNPHGNIQILAFIESLRAEEFLKVRPNLRLLVSTLVAKMASVSPFSCLVLFGSIVKGKAISRSDLDILLILPDQTFQNRAENELASVARTSTIGLHEVVLSSDQFLSMLGERERARKPNLATEILESHIIPYGAEAFHSLVWRVIP